MAMIKTAFCVLILGVSIMTPSVGAEPVHPSDEFTLIGQWVDKENVNHKMVVSERNGLLRLKAGESFEGGDIFAYSAACAREMEGKPYLNCVGWGGKLNGGDFIYSSRLSHKGAGLLEEWFAENGDQVSGKTDWVREIAR